MLCLKRASGPGAPCITGTFPRRLEDRGGWPNRDLANYFADYAGILAKHLGDRITVWAPFNMPWAIAFMGYAAGAFPPCRTSFNDFLKAAHTLALAQAEAHRAVKAASAKATFGSAYEMAPAYPKTDSDDDRAAAARYHAMNNVFFLEAAMQGRYPKAFVGEPPYEQMGFKAGDEKLLHAPLDWIGFHYYTRRIVSDASNERFLGGGNFSGTEIENNSPGGRDPYTRFRAAMPTEGALTDAGLELWPRGMYDLVSQISREYNHPIIEITESGCGYLDGPNEEEHGRIPEHVTLVPRSTVLLDLCHWPRTGGNEWGNQKTEVFARIKLLPCRLLPSGYSYCLVISSSTNLILPSDLRSGIDVVDLLLSVTLARGLSPSIDHAPNGVPEQRKMHTRWDPGELRNGAAGFGVVRRMAGRTPASLLNLPI